MLETPVPWWAQLSSAARAEHAERCLAHWRLVQQQVLPWDETPAATG